MGECSVQGSAVKRAGLILPGLHSQIAPPAFFQVTWYRDLILRYNKLCIYRKATYLQLWSSDCVPSLPLCVSTGEVNLWPLASDESSHQLEWPLTPPPTPLPPPLPLPLYLAPLTLPSRSSFCHDFLELRAFLLSKAASGLPDLSARLGSLPLTENKKCWSAGRRF